MKEDYTYISEHIACNWSELCHFEAELEAIKETIPDNAEEISISADDGSITISYSRPKTEKEIEADKVREAQNVKYRYDQYKKLKAEFEGAVVKA